MQRHPHPKSKQVNLRLRRTKEANRSGKRKLLSVTASTCVSSIDPEVNISCPIKLSFYYFSRLFLASRRYSCGRAAFLSLTFPSFSTAVIVYNVTHDVLCSIYLCIRVLLLDSRSIFASLVHSGSCLLLRC